MRIGSAPDVPTSAPTALVGRRDEQRITSRFLARLRTRPTALLIEGAEGIGKSALLRAAVDRARTDGVTLLTARAAEDEMAGTLVGLDDLFGDVEGAAATVLAPVAEPLERGRAVLDQLRAMARSAPVLLAIDDVQWLDASSARPLRYALRRLETEPVGVVATWRGGPPEDDRVGLRGSLLRDRTDVLTVGPMGPDDLRHLVDPLAAPLSPVLFRRVYEVSGGNPLYAIELVRSLAADARTVDLDAGIRLPQSLRSAIDARLEAVDAGLLELLEIVAAAGAVDVAVLADLHPADDVTTVVTDGERRGFLLVEHGLTVRFRHPLLASGVYGRIPTLRRRALHASLVAALPDPDARARHLALSQRDADPRVAALLERAAARARERGASDRAAQFSDHAARLTPASDDEARYRRRLAQVGDLAAAGEVRRARVLVDRLVEALPPGPRRAEMLLHRFHVENDDLQVGDATLVRALLEAGDDAALRGRLFDTLGWFRGVFRGDLRAGIACGEEAVDIARGLADTSVWMVAQAHLAHMRCMVGDPDEAEMDRTVRTAELLGGPRLGGGPRAWLGKQRLWAGDLAGAREIVSELLDPDHAHSNELSRPYRCYDAGLVACASGDFADAHDWCRLGLTAARAAENVDAEGWMLYPTGLTLAWLGRTDEADELTGRLLAWPGRPGSQLGATRALSVAGLRWLSDGEHATAADHLTEACRLAGLVGIGHPGVVPVVSDAVIALASVGRLDEAAGQLTVLAPQAAAVGTARVTAMLEHARGVLALAQGDAVGAVGLLSTAATTFERLGFRPDAARVGLALGRAYIRSGKRVAASRSLSAARALFDAMGAVRWSAQVDTELERLGTADGALTATESQVAALVADGAKNREISASLFMSLTTVEAHLTRIYRKLEIRSRTDLTRLVHEGTLELASTPAVGPGG